MKHFTKGNYRPAHDFLLNAYKSLTKAKVRVPIELDRLLLLLHSYILVKVFVLFTIRFWFV